MSIGDVQSQERGSGARFNTGKPPMNLIPLRVMAAEWRARPFLKESQLACVAALDAIGRFQEGGTADDLCAAFTALGDGWHDCAAVFDYGRAKYAEWNWAKGMPWSVPIACAARHLQAMFYGHTMDGESTHPHRGHVYCNLVMLATYTRTYPEGDDRPVQWFNTP